MLSDKTCKKSNLNTSTMKEETLIKLIKLSPRVIMYILEWVLIKHYYLKTDLIQYYGRFKLDFTNHIFFIFKSICFVDRPHVKDEDFEYYEYDKIKQLPLKTRHLCLSKRSKVNDFVILLQEKGTIIKNEFCFMEIFKDLISLEVDSYILSYTLNEFPKNLKILKIKGYKWRCSGIDCPNFNLSILKCRCRGSPFKKLERFKELTYLKISRLCTVYDRSDVLKLEKLEKLVMFRFVRIIKKQLVIYFDVIPRIYTINLKSLLLNGFIIDKIFVESLSKMNNLAYINLDKTKLRYKIDNILNLYSIKKIVIGVYKEERESSISYDIINGIKYLNQNNLKYLMFDVPFKFCYKLISEILKTKKKLDYYDLICWKEDKNKCKCGKICNIYEDCQKVKEVLSSLTKHKEKIKKKKFISIRFWSSHKFADKIKKE